MFKQQTLDDGRKIIVFEEAVDLNEVKFEPASELAKAADPYLEPLEDKNDGRHFIIMDRNTGLPVAKGVKLRIGVPREIEIEEVMEEFHGVTAFINAVRVRSRGDGLILDFAHIYDTAPAVGKITPTFRALMPRSAVQKLIIALTELVN